MGKKSIIILAVAGIALMCGLALCSGKYETFSGDPLDTKIYTLDNGLKVFMSVNKETPRIQTYIAVRSGGKNDPADNTGLAHYLEHIMFKGSTHFGTMDYEAEKPMLEEIRQLFDIYGQTTDPAGREQIYHKIDSVSYEASKIAIPNEYDKMMSIIGSEGSNAFTSEDVTCYQEDIPSNQIENWAKVQSDRFKNMVVRGFHTELEAVYEEKNMGMVNDTRKMLEKLNEALFKKHPYGTQTVIGTQEHLKNPSITAILKQKETYYVPNNCAICVSGDFDPDNMVEIIEKYFGDWQPNPAIPEFKYEPEDEMTEPVEIDIYGQDAEFVTLGWRCPGNKDLESEIGLIATNILYNGMAGLIDLNVLQQQKANQAFCFLNDMTDYSEVLILAYPRQGQPLIDVAANMLDEVENLRNGDFDESLLKAAVNNLKLQSMRMLTSNRARAMEYVNAFVAGTPWKVAKDKLARLENVSKEDVMAWAGKYLRSNNYVIVNKHIGTDPDIKKIDAPKITPIVTNRAAASDFLTEVQNSVPEPIEPVFVDYAKDMSVSNVGPLELLYKQNTLNDIATLTFYYENGTVDNPLLDLTTDYIGYLGTPSMTAAEIAKQMYGLACEFSFKAGTNSTSITISGLSENIEKALDITEDLLYNAVGEDFVLLNLITDVEKSRSDSKLNQRACSQALSRYIAYGPDFIKATTASERQLADADSEGLLKDLRALAGKQHKILYYGPQSCESLQAMLKEHHKVAEQPEPLAKTYPVQQVTPQSKVFVAPYKARQFNYIQYSNRGEGYEAAEEPRVRLFNEYFGGGMNAIVFQEMREARALAYSAGAWLSLPTHLKGTASFRASIASQNDKLAQAVNAFDDIINNMPESDKALEIAKTGIISRIRTNRLTGINVIYQYLADKELGLTEPSDKTAFEVVGNLGMDDLKAIHDKWIAGRSYVYGIVGDTSDLDMGFLRKLGPVKVVSLEEIFGY